MSKYDSIKFLKDTKARKQHKCYRCGQDIEKGQTYYKESVGRVSVVGLALQGFCTRCYEEYGDALLTWKL